MDTEDRTQLVNILEATNAGTWEWNVQTGETRFNERSAAIIGRTLAELGKTTVQTWLDYIQPDDLECSLVQLRKHVRGEADYFDCEARMRHTHGHWVWVQAHGRVVSRTPEGKPLWLCGTHVDITAQKHAEQRLRASEALLDRTGQLASVGGWQVDLDSQEITSTDEACRMLDVPPGHRPTVREALGYCAPESIEVITSAVQKSLTDGSRWDVELPFVTATGRHIWVRMIGDAEFEDGRPKRLIGALQDITFHKRAVHALEISERRFRRLFQHSLGLICTHDLDGILLSVNPAAALTLGYSLAELIGRRLTEFMRPEYHPMFDLYLARIVANGTDSGLLMLVGKNGFSHTWKYDNVLDNEDEEPYVLGHAQDITERLLHEQQLHEWSIRDPLTNCFNRRYLAELSTTVGDEDLWGCVVVDLDQFKQVNDTHGHQRGDEILVAMSRFLETCVQPEGIVIRTGGDEFAVFLKAADAEHIARMIERINHSRELAPSSFTLGYSEGRGGNALDSTLAAADKHLYSTRARRRGETRF